MNKYFLLLSLTVISCSKGDEVNITTSNNVPNNEVSFVNSGNIYFENNTCKCPDASNGDKDIISGVTYTAVNNVSIKEEILECHSEETSNPVKNAPHTLSMITADDWPYEYSREKAAFPLDFVRENKFWPSVRRADEAFGDRNLMCTCAPMESYS